MYCIGSNLKHKIALSEQSFFGEVSYCSYYAFLWSGGSFSIVCMHECKGCVKHTTLISPLSSLFLYFWGFLFLFYSSSFFDNSFSPLSSLCFYFFPFILILLLFHLSFFSQNFNLSFLSLFSFLQIYPILFPFYSPFIFPHTTIYLMLCTFLSIKQNIDMHLFIVTFQPFCRGHISNPPIFHIYIH